MKSLKLLPILLLAFFAISCQQNVSYKIKNSSDYDVTVIDKKEISYPEYFIKSNSVIYIDHATVGNFVIKNNEYPITIYNYFDYSEIIELKSYDLTVCNNTSKSYLLRVTNSTYPLESEFNINQNYTGTLKIYPNTIPKIELYQNDKLYENYVTKDSSIIIL